MFCFKEECMRPSDSDSKIVAECKEDGVLEGFADERLFLKIALKSVHYD